MNTVIGKIFCIIALTLLVNACTTQDGPPHTYVDVTKIPDAKPRPLAKSAYGNPNSYVAVGHRYYVLKTAKGYNQRGIASWYGTKFHGALTSTREPYNMFAMTAASPVLPIPCFVRVTNLENGKSIIVKVNDRGPFAPNRIIDLSYVGAKKLGYIGKGTALVQVTAIDTDQPHFAQQTVTVSKTAVIPHPKLYLQLGAFRNYQYAQALKNKVQHLTYRTVIVRETNDQNHPMYRVRIGPLLGVGESDQLHQELRQRGLGEAITVIS